MSKRGRQTRNTGADPQYEAEKNKPVAFVICVPMESALIPLTSEIPPCLVPLCNSPVLLYVLNWLNVNGFEKIYILCRQTDSRAINKVVDQCRVRMLMESIELICSTGESINSMGEAFRFIDSYGKANNFDFSFGVIVPGTLVTNIPIRKTMAAFIERALQAQKNAKEPQPILNTVFTQSSNGGYSAVVADDGELLHLQPPSDCILNFDPNPLTLKPEFFKNHHSFKIKTGLTDSSIYIIQSQLVANFTSEFDWASVIDDCIPSQIAHFEFYDQIILSSFFPDSFAASVNDLPSYLTASLAVIRRWLYPVTVEMNFFAPSTTDSQLYIDFENEEEDDDHDSPFRTPTSSPQAQNNLQNNLQNGLQINLPNGLQNNLQNGLQNGLQGGLQGSLQNNLHNGHGEECTAFRLERDLVYLHDNVFPSLTAKVGHSVVIGSGTTVSGGAVIRNSVIGSDCTIGEGAEIEDCVLWDHVTVEAGAKLNHSVIASCSTIKAGVHINFGCLVSFSCTVETDLPPCRRLTNQPDLTPFGTFGTDGAFTHAEPPQWLANYVSQREPLPLPPESDCGEFVPAPMAELSLLKLWEEISPADFPIDPKAITSSSKDSPLRRFKSVSLEEEDTTFAEEDDNDDFIQLNEDFVKTAVELLTELYTSNTEKKQIQTEYVSLKNAHYAEHVDCAAAIAQVIVAEFSTIEEGLEQLGYLIAPFLENSDDQVDFLFWWQQWCAKDLELRKQDFSEMLVEMEKESIIHPDNLAAWGSPEQQSDCSENQSALFQYYMEMKNNQKEQREEEEDQ